MRLWMRELIHKCSRNVANPRKMVMWLKAVELDDKTDEEARVLGRLYEPSFAQLGNKILEGLEKIMSGEFKRQADHLRDWWLTLNPVSLLTERLVLKIVFDKNRVDTSNWHWIDYQKLGTVELKNDNLAKLLADWD